MSETVQLKDGCAPSHAPHRSASNGGAVQFGSNVSRLKSRFLQHVSDVVEPASCHGGRPVIVHQSSLPSSSTMPASSGPDLLDMSDHVEKFRHTRALFAQLAEQNSVVRPSAMSRSVPRSFRSTSSASPPPARSGHVDPARRSVSPSTSRSLTQTAVTWLQQTQGQTRSCNGSVTTWSQLESRSFEDSSGSRSRLVSGSLDEGLQSEVTSRSLAETSRSLGRGAVEPSDVAGVVLRRNNRAGLDLSVGGAGRAVLLPKRRSREEKSLMVSKDCLEASLCQADEYWRRQQLEELTVGDSEALMSESTFSSGSGEEMARSESGHDLAAALKDTTVSPTADSAEMWSRRLSAALEAKNSEVDGSRTDCNGGCSHVIPRTTENGVLNSSRSLWPHCDLEKPAGGNASDCETCICSAADYSHHTVLQHNNATTIPCAVDLSRSSASLRSSVNSAGGSVTVLETVKDSSAYCSQHITVGTATSSNLPISVNLDMTSDPSRSCSAQCDLDSTLTVSESLQGSVADSSQDVSLEIDRNRTSNVPRSLSARSDLERGSETDCETLEGSVTDCECKDVDTEKSSLLRESTNCCETKPSNTSRHSDTVTAAATVNEEEEEGRFQPCTCKDANILTNGDVKQHETETHIDSTSQLQGDGDACLAWQKLDTTCGPYISDDEFRETVVTCSSSEIQNSHVYNLSTNAAGIFLQKTETSDTIVLDHQDVGMTWSTQWHREADGVADTGSLSESRVQNVNDVQAMSVSEDDESSGDTDYVVLGEPVSKQTALKGAVNQSQQSIMP